MMTDELANSLRRAYPTGRLWEMDKRVLVDPDRNSRIRFVLDYCCDECGIKWETMPNGWPCYEFIITQREHLGFREWLDLSNRDKVTWTQRNGSPLVALWLRISRIANYYECCYNHWLPNSQNGHLCPDCGPPPHAEWSDHEVILKERLDRAGFLYCPVTLRPREPRWFLTRTMVPYRKTIRDGARTTSTHHWHNARSTSASSTCCNLGEHDGTRLP